jgi:P-type conjugative transfer protein TrbJ
MNRLKRRLVVGAAAILLVPTGALATQIVFDPTNFTQTVEQVSQDIQLVTEFRQEVQNQLAMLQNWGFSQLAGILQSMNTFQQVFTQAGTIYVSTDPGVLLNQEFPSTPTAYASVSDSSMQAMRNTWDQEERNVLVENRTLQNDTYQSLAPTAQRIGQYVQQSNAAPGVTAAAQAGNEELATLVAQVQAMQAQEITDARGEVERDAQEQADEAYGDQQRQAVRADWDDPQAPTTSLVDAFSSANQ